MTKDINQISIVGNLVADPQIFTKNSKDVAYLTVMTGSLASNRKHDEETDREKTSHEVRIFVDHIVNLVRDLKKGDRVVVWGEMRNTREGNYIILLAPQARFYIVK